MLLDDELDAFVNAPDEFSARLTDREAQFLALYDLEPPFIINGSVKPLSQWGRKGGEHAAAAGVGDVLTGVPGSPGQATGRARVILDPGDPTGLEPGDVLIAPITDPAWTPLFVPAAAVVVNVGAQVSVQNATERIPDGALVTVDGSTGTVTIIEG